MEKENYEALIEYERKIARDAEAKVEGLEKQIKSLQGIINDRNNEIERLKEINAKLINQQNDHWEKQKKLQDKVSEWEGRWSELSNYIVGLDMKIHGGKINSILSTKTGV